MENKRIKGITLIALVVTIIVLLILAGVAIVTLMGENGILARASAARNKNDEATAEENGRLEVYEEAIENLGEISLNRGNSLKESTLITNIDFDVTKKTDSSITLNISTSSENPENAVVYFVFCDGIVVNGGTQSTIKVEGLSQETKYQIKCGVIDKEGNAKLSDVKEVTTESIAYLYVEGDEKTDMTGGWTAVVQNSNNVKFSKLDDCLYIHTTSSTYSLSALLTKNKINLTDYDYLCCEIINSSPYDSYISKFGITTVNNSNYPSLTKSVTTQVSNDKATYKLNISDITGEYYPVITGVQELKLYKMWFE